MTHIDRPLTDEERSLINILAIASVAHQAGCDHKTAAGVLDGFIETGEVFLRVDTEDIYLDVAGKAIIHCARDWLAFHAEHPEAIDMQRRARRIPDEEDE